MRAPMMSLLLRVKFAIRSYAIVRSGKRLNPAKEPVQSGQSGRHRGLANVPERMRRRLGPTAECLSEIGGIAEPQRLGDSFDGQIRVAQVLDGHFHSQLVQEVAKGRVLFAQLSSK